MEFPEGFRFGVSMSGFQFEMGCGGEADPHSDWWIWARDPLNVGLGLVSGDLPEDGPGYWSLFKRDHDLVEEMGLDAVRIGIEWSRIFPRPTRGARACVEEDEEGVKAVEVDERCLEELDGLANEQAVERYREILSDLKSRGIHVTLCLNHFTLPLWIHDPARARDSLLGEGPRGWLDRRTVVEFAKYAAYVAYKLGDLVDSWATLNEPRAVAYEGYLRPRSGFPPGIFSFRAYSEALRNLVEAHARAYDALKAWSPKEIPVGVIYDVYVVEPLSEGDEEASEGAWHFFNWWFLDAIARGELALEYSREAAEEPLSRRDLGGRIDWIGVNYYSRLVVERSEPWLEEMDLLGWRIVRGYGFECEPRSRSLAGFPTSDSGWEAYPEGLRKALKEVYERYRVPLVVSENGVADAEDRLRPDFIVEHLVQLWRALVEDRVDVEGYYHWSLVDNYEWHKGFEMKYGLYAVDRETKERMPRESARLYSRIASERAIPESRQP